MRLIRLKGVMARVQLSKLTIYKMMDEGAFPQSVQLGDRVVFWVEHELDEWINNRV